MIWNDAATVIYNGTPVQSVICNGAVIWPSGPLLPNAAWSASGYMTNGGGKANYGIASNPVVNHFAWLSDTHPDIPPLQTGSLYYHKSASAGVFSSAIDTTASSLLYGSRHTGLSLFISASASATGASNLQTLYQVDAGSAATYWSGASSTAISGALTDTGGNQYTLTSTVYWDKSRMTATALLSAASGYIASGYKNGSRGAGGQALYATGRLYMAIAWSGSGVYVP